MRRRRYLSWLLPASILALTLGVVGGIAWLTSRLVDAEEIGDGHITAGRPCTATVRSVTVTNVTFDNDNVYQVDLHVQPDDGSPGYDATVRDTLTSAQAAAVHPGATFRCVTDHDDPTNIEVVWIE
ncbi:hypothetical protein AMIS_21860 [Actinoplanes missouriensis 431]|uniref:Uncharacterized protein n=1 Tax=Actinoplanes missouriensis (strain ATCC 14538 / DSM 43046 / CBS 188.64 / JCM 3121 / NBRC 102363 / NCIMB 12654 / NRRL B-3342 / UNCC 431) TaxID=512565 RepID=I0H319_ACTM4|nr:hypothetical protein [Actinoplanes missouriensis]BAL87406.1 hypothetical protein AMIS_21860 [Actinoplanes missouriensis 431]